MEKLLGSIKSYVDRVFLYNSELWTITNTTSNKIDSFHRRQLRYALNITWPKKISNEELYKITRVIPWSQTILKRRLSWLGHLMRLSTETPARHALSEALIPTKRGRGRPPLTWISMIKNDLIDLNILQKSETENSETLFQKLESLATNRKNWRMLISGAISDKQRKRS